MEHLPCQACDCNHSAFEFEFAFDYSIVAVELLAETHTLSGRV
jgi:hypothetical protein